MLELRRSEDRGTANFGWLISKHSFSFGSYFDPQHVGFSDLLVINEDVVAPGRGFDTHGHRDMEIFTYVLSGELEHKDSMGNGEVIRPGDIQIMSAGTGVRHSEYNPSRETPVHLLQIWVTPKVRGLTPRYDQTFFNPSEKRGRLKLVLSPDGRNGSTVIHQDISVYAGLFDGQESATLTLAPKRYAYVHVARGSLRVNGEMLGAGDAIKFRNIETIDFSDGQDAEVLVFDMRPNELPSY